MPVAGGLLDQDPRFVDAVDVIESEIEAIQEERAKQGAPKK